MWCSLTQKEITKKVELSKCLFRGLSLLFSFVVLNTLSQKLQYFFYAHFLLFFWLKIISFVTIRSAVYSYKLLGQNLPIYYKIFEKPHEKSQAKTLHHFFSHLSLGIPSNMVPKLHKEVSLYFFSHFSP